MEAKELEQKLAAIGAQIEGFINKHKEEMNLVGAASTETKTALAQLGEEWNKVKDRLLAIEQKITAPGGEGETRRKSPGELFVASPGFKALKDGQAGRSGQVEVGDIKTAIVNATLDANQPLVAPQRVPGIIAPGLRRLTIRDLIGSIPVTSNVVQFTRELLFTSAAAMQAGENQPKAESALTFELASATVQTLAHWIPASRQILDDAPALAGYINTRLMYGLKLAEETELLHGDGTGQHLSGLVKNSTAFDTARSSTSDTFIDVLRKAKTQVSDSFFEPSGYILNPHDWETIQLTKTTGSASSGEYIFSNPHVVEDDRIWGLPVVPTPAMGEGQFMCGAFSLGANIWDRNNATVEVSREHSDFFTRNMVAVLVEERLTVTVYRALAFIYGGFPYGS